MGHAFFWRSVAFLTALAIGGPVFTYMRTHRTIGRDLFWIAAVNFAAFWVLAAIHIASIKSGFPGDFYIVGIAIAACPGVALILSWRSVRCAGSRQMHWGRALGTLLLSVLPIVCGYWYFSYILRVLWHNYTFSSN